MYWLSQTSEFPFESVYWTVKCMQQKLWQMDKPLLCPWRTHRFTTAQKMRQKAFSAHFSLNTVWVTMTAEMPRCLHSHWLPLTLQRAEATEAQLNINQLPVSTASHHFKSQHVEPDKLLWGKQAQGITYTKWWCSYKAILWITPYPLLDR